MLQAGNYPDVRIAVHEALVCLVLDKCRAEGHDVVKLASEGAPQLVQKVLCLTGIGGLFALNALPSLLFCPFDRFTLYG